MVVSLLAASASAWGVLMGLSPVLQIRRMLRQRSSREVSLGYFAILLAGFVLILMLMVTVIYNDLTRISWIEHLMPWR